MAASDLSYAAFTGLSATTGAAVSGVDHLIQSLRDIITTPIGSRVMRRDYGSRVPFLLDAPMSRGLVADIVAAVAEACAEWEPRVRLKRIVVAEASPGRLVLALIDHEGRQLDVAALTAGATA